MVAVDTGQVSSTGKYAGAGILTRSAGRTRQSSSKFAHKSEEEFARLLDFYDLFWEYEPRSFPVLRDSAGNPIRFFTPDFYLPEYDLYIEVTTLKQKLATRKHRKIRRVRELYPEIKVKLLNLADFRKLMVKYDQIV